MSTALAMGKVRNLSMLRWTALSALLIILLVGFRDVKGALKDGYSLTTTSIIYSLLYIFLLYISSSVIARLVRVFGQFRRKDITRQIFIAMIHMTIVLAVFLLALGSLSDLNFLDADLYDELTPGFVLLYIAIFLDGLNFIPIVLAVGYIFPLFERARSKAGWLGLLTALLSSAAASFTIPMATLIVVGVHSYLIHIPPPRIEFDGQKAKLTVTVGCHVPDDGSLRVLVHVNNTTGRDLYLQRAYVLTTQKTWVGGNQIGWSGSEPLKRLPRKYGFLLGDENIPITDLLLTNAESTKLILVFSKQELEKALGGPFDQRWNAFYCEVEFDFTYLNPVKAGQ